MEEKFSKMKYIREHLKALGIDPNIISKNKKLKIENKQQKALLDDLQQIKINADGLIIPTKFSEVIVENARLKLKIDKELEIKEKSLKYIDKNTNYIRKGLTVDEVYELYKIIESSGD